jgi:hypothetical protein
MTATTTPLAPRCCGDCGWGRIVAEWRESHNIDCNAPMPDSLSILSRAMRPTEGRTCPCWKPKLNADRPLIHITVSLNKVLDRHEELRLARNQKRRDARRAAKKEAPNAV